VASTILAVPNERRRLGLLVDSKCRLPARIRSTFPVPVILKRLATAFRVLIPLGLRINSFPHQRAANIDLARLGSKREFESLFVPGDDFHVEILALIDVKC
jgi:hypothetical protein